MESTIRHTPAACELKNFAILFQPSHALPAVMVLPTGPRFVLAAGQADEPIQYEHVQRIPKRGRSEIGLS